MPRYDEKTALIVVDMQNDFADPGGNLYVNGGDAIISTINAQIAEAQRAGALVVYTQDWHPESTPHFVKDGGTWPVHCVKNTWGAEFHPHLKVVGDVVQKGTGGEDGYSGFSARDPESGTESSTGLEQMLRDRGIESVVVVGLAADVCVRATALDAVRLGFRTIVIKDATRGVDLNEGDTERAFEEMEKAGATLESAAV
ncbi:MAG: nicotinamidase [Chloroflexota bacterium]